MFAENEEILLFEIWDGPLLRDFLEDPFTLEGSSFESRVIDLFLFKF